MKLALLFSLQTNIHESRVRTAQRLRGSSAGDIFSGSRLNLETENRFGATDLYTNVVLCHLEIQTRVHSADGHR